MSFDDVNSDASGGDVKVISTSKNRELQKLESKHQILIDNAVRLMSCIYTTISESFMYKI